MASDAAYLQIVTRSGSFVVCGTVNIDVVDSHTNPSLRCYPSFDPNSAAAEFRIISEWYRRWRWIGFNQRCDFWSQKILIFVSLRGVQQAAVQ